MANQLRAVERTGHEESERLEGRCNEIEDADNDRLFEVVSVHVGVIRRDGLLLNLLLGPVRQKQLSNPAKVCGNSLEPVQELGHRTEPGDGERLVEKWLCYLSDIARDEGQ
ncbi:hypothetical protein PHLCEN_2v7615 [Hermanssonia centrifuga]|uniref:Uncharacterized protein n=1 Tax=Hermanssonia centrifuga TaxID=98765 RepID=A0A2R6NWK3_9APHY|nr:hypothetical protein PHLCEN_2v7615 [Hermanssonia centrifuga]